MICWHFPSSAPTWSPMNTASQPWLPPYASFLAKYKPRDTCPLPCLACMHENRVKKYMSLSISPLTEADLVETAEVVKLAYNVPYSRKDSLQLYLALQPGGSFIAKNNGSVVGFGGALDYGPFAYIGLMSVHPSMQKQGIGGLLLERLLSWLDARACPTILLDASPAGAPLYTRYAFTENDITVVMQQVQQVPLPQHLPTGVSVLAEQDFPALAAFDTPYFGVDRREI